MQDLPSVEGYWCVRTFTARGKEPGVSGRFNFASWCEDPANDPAMVAGHTVPEIQGRDVDFGEIVVNAGSLLGISRTILVTGKLVHVSGRPVAVWWGRLAVQNDDGSIWDFGDVHTNAEGLFSTVVRCTNWERGAKRSNTLAFCEEESELVCGTLPLPKVGKNDTLITLGEVVLDGPMVHFLPVWPAGIYKTGLVGIDTSSGSDELYLIFETTGGTAFLSTGQHEWLADEVTSNPKLNRPSGIFNVDPKGFLELEIVYEKLPCVVINIVLKGRELDKTPLMPIFLSPRATKLVHTPTVLNIILVQ